ncbi:hypothetical protein INT45_000374 [Circinella minor]|uniref:PH domain-containing protein n=1 Tax=Circinella minor TaxID=1195481 RepID=A0A8H7RVC8_9FUNG|nr:hypothetical protein INT45_000374 [Circinella minor]
MAGHSNQTGVNNISNTDIVQSNYNGSQHSVDSLRLSTRPMSTAELGRSVAPRLEVASLTIQSTAQTSLFPERASATFYQNRRHEWQRHPLAPATNPFPFRFNHVNDNNTSSRHELSTETNDDNDNDDNVNDKECVKLSTSRRTVTFNSDIDEIEISDPSMTPESGSHIVDEDHDQDINDEDDDSMEDQDEELFYVDDDDDEEEEEESAYLNQKDHDSGVNITMEGNQDSHCNNINVDYNDIHENMSTHENNNINSHTDKMMEFQENTTDNHKIIDESKQQQQLELIDGETCSSSTVPTIIDRDVNKVDENGQKKEMPPIIRDIPFIIPNNSNNRDRNKERRRYGDEVLNQLTKRKQQQRATTAWGLTNQSNTTTFHAGPPIKMNNNKGTVQSMESQLMDVILKIKAANQQYCTATPTLPPSKTQSMPSLSSPSKPNNTTTTGTVEFDKTRSKKYATSEYSGSTSSLLLTRTRMPRSTTPSQEPILLRSTPSTTTINTTANTSIKEEKHGKNVNDEQDVDFGLSVMNEFDKITSKRRTYYKARESLTVVHASKTLIENDDQSDGRSIYENGSVVSSAPTERIWREFGSSCQRADTLPPVQNNESKGRLYIRVIAAENLDFPIHSDAPQVRCVLSNGKLEQSTEYHTMEHNISFNRDFYIDVEPSSEFTITLIAGQSTKSNQFRKLLGNRRRSRTDSILRYVNRMDGALAQTRVSLESIKEQCQSKLCKASFALINGWYQYARLGGIIPTHKKDKNGCVPEKAVGKVTVELCYIPCEASKIEKLPINLADCEKGLNVQRCYRTCWQSGYMSQLGGDVKFWRRRYFSLKGWRLFSYTDVKPRSPRVIIDFSQAVSLAADNRIIVPPRAMDDSSSLTTTTTSVSDSKHSLLASPPLPPPPSLHQHQSSSGGDRSSIISSVTTASEDELGSYSVKNSYRITFKNGESINFFCDSAKERDDWLEVLKAIINRVPNWPDWMDMDPDSDHSYTENIHQNDSTRTTTSTIVTVPPR